MQIGREKMIKRKWQRIFPFSQLRRKKLVGAGGTAENGEEMGKEVDRKN